MLIDIVNTNLIKTQVNSFKLSSNMKIIIKLQSHFIGWQGHKKLKIMSRYIQLILQATTMFTKVFGTLYQQLIQGKYMYLLSLK
jgi:hypothetical protein